MAQVKSPLSIGLIAQGGDGWLGGSYYIENLCRALLSLPESERRQLRITLFGSEAQLDRMAGIAAQVDATVSVEDSSSFDFWTKQRFRWERLVNGRKTPWTDDLMVRHGIDFLYPHCPQDSRNRRFRSAAWQPDFQHSEMPAMFSAQEIQERDAGFRQAERFADRIVLISEDARAHCGVHFPAALPKIRVLPFASVIDPAFLQRDPLEATAQYHVPQKFFILSNQFWRHKNHEVVWQALSVLQVRGTRVTVVCTGHTYDYRHPNHFDQLLGQLHRHDLSQQVRILGVIPRDLQLALMRQSVAVIQPSLFEGWGTSVEDARALGCATVLADTPIHREQNPPGSRYFTPNDPQALANVLEALWESSSGGFDAARGQEAAARQVERVRRYAAAFIAIAGEQKERA
jgi:glycosyltransferase involved in cell wall biosynthesis